MSARWPISGVHAAGSVTGAVASSKFSACVVVQDQQPVRPARRVELVLDRVLDAVPARRHHGELARRVGGVQQPDLAGQLARAGDHQVALAAGQADADPEPLVGLLEHDHVARGRGADQVPPDPVGPPGLVHRDVEQRRAVGRPRAAVERAGDLVRRDLAGGQVLDPHGEPLAALEVGRVRELAAVRADVERAQREELAVPRELVPVEQDLLAVQRAAVGPVIGGRGVAGLDRAAALHRVLLALDRPRVVPPAALAVRHRQVGLLGPGLDLVEDRGPQALLARRQRLGVGVLRLQVGDGLRVLLVRQPRELVHEGVPVVDPLARHPPHLRRPGRHLRLAAHTLLIARLRSHNPESKGVDRWVSR